MQEVCRDLPVDTIGTLGDVKKKKKKKTDDRTRRNCEHCGKRTDYICLGCRRFCCFSAPSEKKTGKKHPKHFSVQTPIINPKTGKLRRERRSGDVVHETAVCQWTCYHALHREAWETYTEGKYQILATARGERSEANKKSRRKRKKGTLKTIKEGKDEDNSDGESEEELYDSESDEESVSESEEDSDSGLDEDSDEDTDNDQNDGRIAIQNNGRKRGRSRMSK